MSWISYCQHVNTSKHLNTSSLPTTQPPASPAQEHAAQSRVTLERPGACSCVSQTHPGPFRASRPLRMATPSLQSRDAVTKTTRDDTQALRDFFNETEPPSASSAAAPHVVEKAHQRAPSLGGLSLEKAKARLGLFKPSKKVKDEGEKGSLRISTPPPGTVAITRNSGYACSLLLLVSVFVLNHFSGTPCI